MRWDMAVAYEYASRRTIYGIGKFQEYGLHFLIPVRVSLRRFIHKSLRRSLLQSLPWALVWDYGSVRVSWIATEARFRFTAVRFRGGVGLPSPSFCHLPVQRRWRRTVLFPKKLL